MTTYHPVDELLPELTRGRVIVVVGTGFSIASTRNDPLASWPGLIAHGADYACSWGRLSDTKADAIKAQLSPEADADTLIKLAARVENALQDEHGTFGRWLRASVQTLRVRDDRLLRALERLQAPLVTTNYDTLLSDGSPRQPVLWRDFKQAVAALRDGLDRPSVLHLHGVHTDADSIVFGTPSYSRIVASPFAQLLEQLMTVDRTLLFIGCGPGLGDPNFGPLFSWFDDLKLTHPHFRLVRNAEVGRVADSVVDIGVGERHEQLPAFIEALAADADDRRANRQPPRRLIRGLLGLEPNASGVPSEPATLLLIDEGDEYLDAALRVGTTPWAGTDRGVAVPLHALRRVAEALHHDRPLPSLILIDDRCAFAPGQPARRNGVRTMAALTQLLDAYECPVDRRPACVLYSFLPSHHTEQLPFVELGGHAVVVRQPGEEPGEAVIARALAAAPTAGIAWSPPVLRLRAGADFWKTEFPLLPLRFDDERCPVDVRHRLLGIDARAEAANVRALRRRLHHATREQLSRAELAELAALRGDAAVVAAARSLGVIWMSPEALQTTADLPWPDILPPGAPELRVLQPRSAGDSAVRAGIYPDPADPRHNKGAVWPPSPYLPGAAVRSRRRT